MMLNYQPSFKKWISRFLGILKGALFMLKIFQQNIFHYIYASEEVDLRCYNGTIKLDTKKTHLVTGS